MGRRRATALVAAALALGALAGCSEDEGPEAAATPAPRLPATPSASVTPAPENETAEEFIRRWNSVQNDMQKGDTHEWRRLSTDCSSCIRSADQIDEIYAAGGHIRTAGRKIISVRKSKQTDNPDVYTLTFRSTPTELQRTRAAAKETLLGGKAALEVHVASVDGAWTVKDIWQLAQ